MYGVVILLLGVVLWGGWKVRIRDMEINKWKITDKEKVSIKYILESHKAFEEMLKLRKSRKEGE